MPCAGTPRHLWIRSGRTSHWSSPQQFDVSAAEGKLKLGPVQIVDLVMPGGQVLCHVLKRLAAANN